MIKVFMNDFSRSKYNSYIYKTSFTIKDVYNGFERKFVVGVITVNKNTEKIRIRIVSRYENKEKMRDKFYILSFEEKSLLISKLFNKICKTDKYALGYTLIESNRRYDCYEKNNAALIDEIKKYRFDYNRQNKILIRALNSMYMIENSKHLLDSVNKVFIDVIDDLNFEELLVYNEVIQIYLLKNDPTLKICIEKSYRMFKKIYIIYFKMHD